MIEHGVEYNQQFAHGPRPAPPFSTYQLPATLALHLGLPQLVQECLDLGDAPGRANTGDKMMTLVASSAAW